MATAKVTSSKVGDTLQVMVSGYIGEGAELFDLNFAGVKKVAFDLNGVSYLNSVGVKNWINWTGRFPPDTNIQMYNCPTLIIAQVNMVVGFLPNNGTVESLSAPMICEDCNKEQSVTLTRGKDYQYASNKESYKLQLPEVPCPKCKKPMTLDAVEAKFFNFLKSVR
ncbi:MAG: hypothetical protein AB7N80_04335 [Bdellovibrionales bacterium]